jgi:hypothetical protein
VGVAVTLYQFFILAVSPWCAVIVVSLLVFVREVLKDRRRGQ